MNKEPTGEDNVDPAAVEAPAGTTVMEKAENDAGTMVVMPPEEGEKGFKFSDISTSEPQADGTFDIIAVLNGRCADREKDMKGEGKSHGVLFNDQPVILTNVSTMDLIMATLKTEIYKPDCQDWENYVASDDDVCDIRTIKRKGEGRASLTDEYGRALNFLKSKASDKGHAGTLSDGVTKLTKKLVHDIEQDEEHSLHGGICKLLDVKRAEIESEKAEEFEL